MVAGVDTSFDFHSDTPPGKDPDSHSPTLQRYQQLLWGKDLPVGPRFTMAPEGRQYLVHRSSAGVFHLASDAITTRMLDKAARVIREIPEGDIPAYGGYTAGSTIVFPGNKVGGKMTINGARGWNGSIADRFDLTLECIRRHYLGEWSPLHEVLLRYADFFALFRDFRGYVKFFLLQDLLKDDGKSIGFFHPFDNFRTPAVPATPDEYLRYLEASNAFICARNRRIDGEP